MDIWRIFPAHTHLRHQSLLLQQQQQQQCWWWNRRVFWPEEEGSGARSRRVEHSVPAGDKGEACQGPHSSELTHTVMHVTHIHIHTYSHHYFTFLWFLSVFFYDPFPALLSSFPLCHILLSDFHFFSMHHTFLCACTFPLSLHPVWLYSQHGKDIANLDVKCLPKSPLHGKCTSAINKLSSLCTNDAISSPRASCYESRMS